MAISNGAFLICDDLYKIFKVADIEVMALQGLDLTVRQRRVGRRSRRQRQRQNHADERARRLDPPLGRASDH